MNQPGKNASIEEKLKYANDNYPDETIVEGYIYKSRYALKKPYNNFRGDIIDYNGFCVFSTKHSRWAEVVSRPEIKEASQAHQNEWVENNPNAATTEQQMKCPTCGANVRVEGGNTTQFYVPVESMTEQQIRQDERTKVLNEVIELISNRKSLFKYGSQLEAALDRLIIEIKSILPQPEPDKFEAEAERMLEKNWNELGRIEFKELIVEALKKDPKEI